MDDFSDDWSALGKSFLLELVIAHAKLLAEIGTLLSKRKADSETAIPNKKRRSGGTRGPHFDWNQSTWGKMLLDPKIRLVSTREGRLFRRRFRIPYALFRRIVTMCHDRDLFPFKGKILDGGERVDRANRPVIPLELKILGVLRILGRGWCLDVRCFGKD